MIILDRQICDCCLHVALFQALSTAVQALRRHPGHAEGRNADVQRLGGAALSKSEGVGHSRSLHSAVGVWRSREEQARG